ncbi:hypothetical protein CEXT_702361 [Caerostris extrusa]|uniref:Uncharacterized protein n=1 Tax=Caerostris extrusa TaxID=172846 RepID=A0AAV4NAU6_CAEEX|nr:hypothetical protein CEXT_702361 [Caerostris extrusa]
MRSDIRVRRLTIVYHVSEAYVTIRIEEESLPDVWIRLEIEYPHGASSAILSLGSTGMWGTRSKMFGDGKCRKNGLREPKTVTFPTIQLERGR